MSEKYKFDDPEGIYFVTMTVVNWIDLFTRPELRPQLAQVFRMWEGRGRLVPDNINTL